MTMEGKRRFFTYEGYKRLEQNPFIDEKMLRFIREKWRREARKAAPAASQQRKNGARGESPDDREKKLAEKKLRRMTDAIKSMLRE